MKRLACLLLVVFSSFSAAAVKEPDRQQAYYHFLLGTMKEQARRYSEAIEEYRLALKFDPESGEVFSRLAGLYTQTNRIDEAISEAEKAISKNPDNKEAHRMMGQIFLEKMYSGDGTQMDLARAISEFRQVYRIDPDDEAAVLTLGQLYLQNKQAEQAVDMYTRYLQKNPDSSNAILSLASAYQQLDQTDQAIPYLLKYLEGKPDNFYVVQQLAEFYAKSGDMTRALEFQKRALAADGDNPAIIRKYVDLLERSKNHEEAIRILEQQVLASPDNPEWTILLSNSYQKAGNQEKAEAVLKEIISRDPENLDLQLALVQVYEEGERFPQAIELLQNLVLKTTSHPSIGEKERASNLALYYSHLGYSCQQLKEYDRSIEFYRKAREYAGSGQAAKIDFYIALNLRAQKKYDEAVKLLQSVAEENPDDTSSRELLSLIYEEKGDPRNSDLVIEKLISQFPDRPDYFIMKAERLQQREQYANSIEALKSILPKFQDNDQIYFLLGSASERLKQYDAAENYFKKCIEINPQNSNALNYLGYMLIDQGIRIEESIEYVKRALDIEDGNGAYLDSLGWGYYKLNRLDLAEDNLRMALDKMGDNAVVHDHMGDLHFKQGRFREAIEHWELALKNKTNEIDPAQIRKKIDDTKNRLQ